MGHVLVSVDEPQQGLVVVRETCHVQRQGRVSPLLGWLGELERLLSGQYLEDLNRIRSYHLVDEHFIVAECLILPFLAILEVQLFEYVEVVQVHEVSLRFRPHLDPIAAGWQLNANELGVIVRTRVVDDRQELGDVAGSGNWAVKDGVILAP